MAEIDPLAFQRSFQASQNMFDQQRQNKLQDLLMGQKVREIEQENKLASLYQGAVGEDGKIDRTRLLSGAAQSGLGNKIPGLQTQFAQQDKAQREADKARLDGIKQNIEIQGQLLGSVRDEASYQQALQVAQANGIDVSKLPPSFDPAFIQQARARAMTAAQQVEQEWKQKGYDKDMAQFAYRQQNDQQNREVTLRGQDMSQSTAIRGQDLTDQRAREAQAAQAAKDKAPTEFQGKSATFGARAEQADKVLTDLTGKYSPLAVNAKQGAGNIWVVGGALEAAGNKLLPKEAQQAEQAMRDFINAVLRQESGAAIAQSEFDNAARQYFPQPGDSEAVIAQKAQNRKTAIEGFKKNAGKAAYTATLTGTPAPRSGGGASANWDAPAPNDALAELQRRAASDPAVAAKLKAMGY